MDPCHPSLLRFAVTAIAICFSVCGEAAPVEHVRTQNESASPAADPSSGADIERGLTRVNAARSSAEVDPLALEEALTALGDAYLNTNQYAPAEAAYAEAMRSAEQHGERETQRVLAPLTGLGTTFARAGHHHDAIPLLQRAVAITRAQFGMFDLRQQDAARDVGRQPHCARSPAGSAGPHDLQGARRREDVRRRQPEGHSMAVRPGQLVRGHWQDARSSHDFSGGPQHRWHDGHLECADHRRAPARDRAGLHAPRSSYPDSWRKPPYPTLGCGLPYAVVPPECKNPAAFDAGGFNIEPRTLNQEGENALKHALRILDSDPGSAAQTRIETLIQMGDWYQIKKSPREALTYYERAWQLIRTTPNLPDSAATALNVPLRVYYPTPQIVAHVPILTAAVDTTVPTTCRRSSRLPPMAPSATLASSTTTRAIYGRATFSRQFVTRASGRSSSMDRRSRRQGSRIAKSSGRASRGTELAPASDEPRECRRDCHSRGVSVKNTSR